MANLNLLAFRDNIEEAFKSLIQSGRPDIRDEENIGVQGVQTR